MSSQTPRPDEVLKALRRAARVEDLPAVVEEAREIETNAGAGLRPEYWVRPVETRMGYVSRRALAFTFLGLLLAVIVFLGAAAWRLTTLPEPVPLAEQDAAAVIAALHTQFEGTGEATIPFTPPNGEQWRYAEAYTFYFQEGGQRRQVVIMSYDSFIALNEDYRDRSRTLTFGDAGVYTAPEITAETRLLRAYGSDWLAFRLSNVLMLMSPEVSQAMQQALLRDFISIVIADQREIMP